MAKAYHRDDLRNEILTAGHAFIAANGHGGLSVRALAQQLGVSAGAPYHHFPDRRSLLVALAVDGFKALNERAEAIGATAASPAEKLAALAHAFLDFCAERPRLLELMYDSELTRPTLEPALADAQRFGFRRVVETVGAMLEGAGEEHIRHQALAFWSTLYGFGALTSKGILAPSVVGQTSSRDLTEAVVGHAVALTKG